MSLQKLASAIYDIKENIPESKYLEIMNTLKELYEEKNAVSHSISDIPQDITPQVTIVDENEHEITIILSESDKIIINDTQYYVKLVSEENMVFEYPIGNPIGILINDTIHPIEWI